MPWQETRKMDERTRFVLKVRDEGMSVAQACRDFNVSRKTGYKWLKRFDEHGIEALDDQSRAPKTSPNKTPDHLRERIVRLRRRYPTWGSRKLRAYLLRQSPNEPWPASSTVHDILLRHGLVEPKKTRTKTQPHTQPLAHAHKPNELWSIDYKGQFRLGNGQYCYPLTVTDNFSRMILGCVALNGTGHEGARKGMEGVFKEHGLPRAIRSDNGVPFATKGVLGLSQLSAWWLALGIEHERIEPGHPEQNGRHERMHLTLKRETARPAAKDMEGQQERFDAFRNYFNQERPHEALGQKTPASVHKESAQRLSQEPLVLDYEGFDVVKKVHGNGQLNLRYGRLFVGMALAGWRVGLLELDEGVWLANFAGKDLGVFEVGDKRLSKLEVGKVSRRMTV